MTVSEDLGGNPGSNLVNGTGTNTVTFRLPSNMATKVQSVVATVDNAAGGDATAKVTVLDGSGVVIATNTQADPIPAGDTGTATFALRLNDNGAGGIRFRKLNTGGWLYITTTTTDPADGNSLFINAHGPTAMQGTDLISWQYPGADLEMGGDVTILSGTSGGGGDMRLHSQSGAVDIASSTHLAVNGGGGDVQITGAQLGFFGQTPTAQPAHPVTLADVIAALTALGLTA